MMSVTELVGNPAQLHLLFFALAFRDRLRFFAELMNDGLLEHLIGSIDFVAGESTVFIVLGLDNFRVDTQMSDGLDRIAYDADTISDYCKLATTIGGFRVESACDRRIYGR